MKFENVSQVAAHRLCVGCGTCAFICQEEKVQLVDVEDDGIRPIVLPGGCDSCNQCLIACTGLNTSVADQQSFSSAVSPTQKSWWESIRIVWEVERP
jgi:coenzyme F420 hydrogenase subunit beta